MSSEPASLEYEEEFFYINHTMASLIEDVEGSALFYDESGGSLPLGQFESLSADEADSNSNNNMESRASKARRRLVRLVKRIRGSVKTFYYITFCYYMIMFLRFVIKLSLFYYREYYLY